MTTDKPNWDGNVWWVPGTEPPALHIVLNQQEAQELRTMLNRALNTLNPDHWPKWAAMLVEKLQSVDNSAMHRAEPQHDQSTKVGVTG